MGFDISSISDIKFKMLAQKADSDGNGKIEDNEISVFNQLKDSYSPTETASDGSISSASARVGNVDIENFDNVEYVRKNEQNEDTPFDYTVKYKSGPLIEYDRQKFGSNASICSGIAPNTESLTLLKSLEDGKGVRYKGTKGDDNIFVIGSKISGIDGRNGSDKIISKGSTVAPGAYIDPYAVKSRELGGEQPIEVHTIDGNIVEF